MREDLLALDEDSLIQLANRGLYKRAKKMLQDTSSYQLSLEGTAVGLQYGDVTTRLEEGVPLAKTECSCGADKVCRHRILAVLAFQQSGQEQASSEAESEPWNPGDFSDELFPKELLTRAGRRLKSPIRVELRHGPKPIALLPTCNVSFLVPGQLEYARCDCKEQELCHHMVWAVWAFRKGGAETVVELGESSSELALSWQPELYEERLLYGLAHAADDLDAKFEELESLMEEQGARWMVDLAHDARKSCLAYSKRKATYSYERACRELLEWRVRKESSSSRVLGLGKAAETRLEHMVLKSIGANVRWRDGQTQLHTYLVDPNNSTVLVYQKTWNEEVEGSELLKRNLEPNLKLEKFVKGSIVTSSAHRRANRSLRLSRNKVAPTSANLLTTSWSEVFQAPLLVEEYAQLQERLRKAEHPFVKARSLANQVFILKVDEIAEFAYDPGTQEFWAGLCDSQGHPVLLKRAYRRSSPLALDCIAQALDEGVEFVSGKVRLRKGRMEIEPLALVGDKIWIPDLDVASERKLETDSLHSDADPIESLLARAWDLLCRAVHEGLLHLSRSWKQDVKECSSSLREAGFLSLAQDLSNCATDLPEDELTRSWLSAALRAELTLRLYVMG